MYVSPPEIPKIANRPRDMVSPCAAYRSTVFRSFAKQRQNRGTTVPHIYTALTTDLYQSSYHLSTTCLVSVTHLFEADMRRKGKFIYPIFSLEFRETEQGRA